MREINNNMDIGKVSKADFRSGKAEKSEPQICSENEKTGVKDFSNPTESLGRSQVSKTDNLKADVDFGMAHPETISSADKFFNIAYAQLVNDNDPNAYEKASTMASIYAKEFC